MNSPLPVTSATLAQVQVALVTCRELAQLEDDDRLVLAPLAERGVTARPEVWDDPAVDWSAYDLVVLRSPWDYFYRRDQFVDWAARVPRLANPGRVVAWNTDKRYLRELAAAGVPVVATEWVAPGEGFTPPAGEYVVKPAVSAGSRDTGRYRPGDEDLARAHVTRLQKAGRLIMIQPYLPAVDADGETALLFFAAPATGRLEFSHAVRKGPMLTGPDSGSEGLYVQETIDVRIPTEAEHAVARCALAAAPDGLLYARVDLIPGAGGEPVLVELELTEPSVFLGYAEGAAERFADAIAARLAG